MKKITVVLLAAAAFSLLAGCAGSAAPAAGNTAAVSAPAASTPPAPAAQNGLVIEANPGPGPYTGRASGYHGAVEVTLDVQDRVLVSITAVGHEETPGIGSLAIDTLPDAMLKGNTIVVDALTGATFTSEGIMEAAAKALASAGLTDADLKR
ncbi:MAG: FMN-binding protein [Spirochaetaceae bacterium]|nr:FMN-binding protein [Spirochaetaceae bacterium]